jgi:hypothetical protein
VYSICISNDRMSEAPLAHALHAKKKALRWTRASILASSLPKKVPELGKEIAAAREMLRRMDPIKETLGKKFLNGSLSFISSVAIECRWGGIYEAADGSFCNEEFIIGGERCPTANAPLLYDCLRAFQHAFTKHATSSCPVALINISHYINQHLKALDKV